MNVKENTKVTIKSVDLDGHETFRVNTSEGVTILIETHLKQGDEDLTFVRRQLKAGDVHPIWWFRVAFKNWTIKWY